MNIDLSALKTELKAKTKPGFNVDLEAQHILRLIKLPAFENIAKQYEYEHFIAPGGSGLIFQVKDNFSKTSRALKVSRSGAVSPLSDPDDPVNVQLEIEALSLVSHQNITHFFDGIIGDDKSYMIVTQLVNGAKTISEWVDNTIGLEEDNQQKESSPQSPDNSDRWSDQELQNILLSLAWKLHGYSLALSYMHGPSCELYHMDIKPGNLLVDANENPFVTDLGFARCKKHYTDPDQLIPVGFTYGFNHPFLADYNKHKFRAPSTLAKARNNIPVKELNQRFDLYSFGRTILFLLRIIEHRFGNRVQSQYAFLYLHLLATLLLDARNTKSVKPDSFFLNEVALGIDGNLLEMFKFDSFDKVTNRLNRLLGMHPVEYRLPELNRWFPRSLNHGVGYLNITARVHSIIEHPAFRRLKDLYQLGVVSEVFDGATHTRHAHCLGVTGVVCEYLQALYNDPENPIFNILVEDNDLKAMIAAALIHDLGQSEFGHELEEIDEKIYSHSQIVKMIIDNDDYCDSKRRTLKKILEGNDYTEWGLKQEDVLAILNSDSVETRFVAFKNIINGPIDADKVDYLLRDSGSCNVTYPRGLDVERLLKCITVLPVTSSDHKRSFLKLGIKQKGLASSEIVTLSRHKMYQSVYLQHTARALKAIISTACAQANGELKKKVTDIFNEPLFAENIELVIREMFVCHLIRRTPKFPMFQEALRKTNPTKQKDIRLKLDRLHEVWNVIVNGHDRLTREYSEYDRSISFFYGFVDDASKNLFRAYSDRIVYKRLSEVSFAQLDDDDLEKLKDKLAWQSRQIIMNDISVELKNTAKKILENRDAMFFSLNENPGSAIDYLESVGQTSIIVDFPGRNLGPGGTAPPVLKDINRKRGEYYSPDISLEGVGHIWRNGMKEMMKEISFCRIYCEPNYFQILTATMDPSEINSIIQKHIPWGPE